jgi:hypothetical protein
VRIPGVFRKGAVRESVQRVGEFLHGRPITERGPQPSVQASVNTCEILLWVFRKVGALPHVLAMESVGVHVRSAQPW